MVPCLWLLFFNVDLWLRMRGSHRLHRGVRQRRRVRWSPAYM